MKVHRKSVNLLTAHTLERVNSLDGGEELGRAEAAAVENTMFQVVFLQVHTPTGLVVTQLTLMRHVHVTDVMNKQVAITVYLLLELCNR